MSAILAESMQPRALLADGLPANDRPIPAAWTHWQQDGGFWGNVAEYFAERHTQGLGVYRSPYQSTTAGTLADLYYDGLSEQQRALIDRQRDAEVLE